MTIAERIMAVVAHRPGLTEAELADALFGRAGYQARVSQVCRSLVRQGRIERRGRGGLPHPFRYYGALAQPRAG